MNPYLNRTLTVPLCTFRSILEPEAPPEATKKRYRLSAFQAGHIPSCYRSCECSELSPVAAACRWSLLLLSGLLSTRRRPPSGKPTRTLQGMARARSGQAPAWPLVSDRSVRRGSRVKRDFAWTFTRHFSPVLVALRVQSCLRLDGRTRTLSGPSPDPRAARTFVLSVCCVPSPCPISPSCTISSGFLCRPGFHRGRSYVPDADPGGLGSLTSQNSIWLPVCRK